MLHDRAPPAPHLPHQLAPVLEQDRGNHLAPAAAEKNRIVRVAPNWSATGCPSLADSSRVVVGRAGTCMGAGSSAADPGAVFTAHGPRIAVSNGGRSARHAPGVTGVLASAMYVPSWVVLGGGPAVAGVSSMVLSVGAVRARGGTRMACGTDVSFPALRPAVGAGSRLLWRSACLLSGRNYVLRETAGDLLVGTIVSIIALVAGCHGCADLPLPRRGASQDRLRSAFWD
jgi:hypothetical protein